VFLFALWELLSEEAEVPLTNNVLLFLVTALRFKEGVEEQVKIEVVRLEHNRNEVAHDYQSSLSLPVLHQVTNFRLAFVVKSNRFSFLISWQNRDDHEV